MFSRMDEFGRPAWVLATVAAFWMFWPLGLAVLAYLAWTGRLKTMTAGGMGEAMSGAMSGAGQWFNLRGDQGAGHGGRSSGNKAFDDYRAETLRRLEEEQREFKDTWSGCAARGTRRSSTASWPTAAGRTRRGTSSRRKAALSRRDGGLAAARRRTAPPPFCVACGWSMHARRPASPRPSPEREKGEVRPSWTRGAP